MQILKYPHPILRHKSKPLTRVDAEFKRIVEQMFEKMYEDKGIGLAANQVGLPYRFFVANLSPDSQDEDGEMVFINPVISKRTGTAEAEEGCLSLPGIYAQVKRPEKVTINAFSLRGEELEYELSGLHARVVQHETDHLDGVLFIDRLSPAEKLSVKEYVEDLEIEFHNERQRGRIPDDDAIASHLAELEGLRT